MTSPDVFETEPQIENIPNPTVEQIGSLTLKEWVDNAKKDPVRPVGRFEVAIKDGIAAGFEATKPAMSSLAEQLAPSIRKGEWTAVLGDDSKGRLPALVIGGLTSRWAHAHGQPAPSRKFIAGGRTLSDQPENVDHEVEADRLKLLKDYIDHIKPELGKRTLVVTEMVTEGEGMGSLLSALRESGVSFDLAIVESSNGAEETKKRLHDLYPQILDDSDIYIGRDSLGADDHVSAFANYSHQHHLINTLGISRTEFRPVASATGELRTQTRTAREEARRMTDELYTQLTERE